MAQAMTEGVYGRTMQKCPDPSEKTPSPGGWYSAQRIQNLYDCRWQSYLYYGVTG